MARYFVHDLESDRLLIYTGGKSDWMTVPEADRDIIKRGCLWSSSRSCWMSRSKGGRVYFKDVLVRNGFEDRGKQGEKLSFAEQVEQKIERAEDRAERMENRAIAASSEADRRFNSDNIETLRAMQGEPVKLGHHSAGRHLRLIEKADNDMRKGCEALEKRDHYQDRAEAARATATAAEYRDPAYLQKRIYEQEAVERDILRRLEGKGLINPEAGISDAYRERLNAVLATVRDKLEFYRKCLNECGVVVWTKDTLKGKEFVLIRGRWEKLIRCNAKTVSVYNTCFNTEESQRKWPLKYVYGEVKGAK